MFLKLLSNYFVFDGDLFLDAPKHKKKGDVTKFKFGWKTSM